MPGIALILVITGAAAAAYALTRKDHIHEKLLEGDVVTLAKLPSGIVSVAPPSSPPATFPQAGESLDSDQLYRVWARVDGSYVDAHRRAKRTQASLEGIFRNLIEARGFEQTHLTGQDPSNELVWTFISRWGGSSGTGHNEAPLYIYRCDAVAEPQDQGLTAQSLRPGPRTLDAGLTITEASSVDKALFMETDPRKLQSFSESMAIEYPVAQSFLLAKARLLSMSGTMSGGEVSDDDAFISGLTKLVSNAAVEPIKLRPIPRAAKQAALDFFAGRTKTSVGADAPIRSIGKINVTGSRPADPNAPAMSLCDRAMDAQRRRSPAALDLAEQCLESGGKFGNMTLADIQKTQRQRQYAENARYASCEAARRAIESGSPYAGALVMECRSYGYRIDFDGEQWKAYLRSIDHRFYDNGVLDAWGTPHEGTLQGRPLPTFEASPDYGDWHYELKRRVLSEWSGDVAALFGTSRKLNVMFDQKRITENDVWGRHEILQIDGYGMMAAGASTRRFIITTVSLDLGPLNGPINTVKDIVREVDKALPVVGAILKTVAPFVEFIPGIGLGLGVAMTAAGALACSESLEDIVIETVGAVIPTGPLRTGFEAGCQGALQIIRGVDVEKVLKESGRAVAVGLGGERAGDAFDIGVATIDSGKIDAALLKAARRQIGESMGVEALAAYDMAVGVAQGKSAGNIGKQVIRDYIEASGNAGALILYDGGMALAEGKSLKEAGFAMGYDLIGGDDLEAKLDVFKKYLPFAEDGAKAFFGQELADRLSDATGSLQDWAKQNLDIGKGVDALLANSDLLSLDVPQLAQTLGVSDIIAKAVKAAVRDVNGVLLADPELLRLFCPMPPPRPTFTELNQRASFDKATSIMSLLGMDKPPPPSLAQQVADPNGLYAKARAASKAKINASVDSALERTLDRTRWVGYYQNLPAMSG